MAAPVLRLLGPRVAAGPPVGGGSTPPGAPGAPVSSAVTSTTATLTWTASSAPDADPVTAYRIDKTSPGTTTGFASTGGALTVGLTGLTPATTYTFVIVATNGAGDSAPSASGVVITTSADPPPVGIVPTRAETFARSFGVNTHANFGYAPHDKLTVVDDWITDLGVRVIRDHFAAGQADQVAYYKSIYDNGCQVHTTVDTPATILLAMKSAFPAGGAYPADEVFRSVGGTNEPNNTSATRGARTWDWATVYRNAQKALYQAIKADPDLSTIPVASGALKDAAPDLAGDAGAGNWMQDLGTSWGWEGTGPQSTVGSQSAMLSLPNGAGRIAIRTDVSDIHGKANCHFLLTAATAATLANWKKLEFHPGLASLTADPIAGYVDIADYHKYPGGGNTPSTGLSQREQIAVVAYAAVPGDVDYCTEAAYHTSLVNQAGGQGVPTDVQAKYELVLWADHYKYGLDTQGVGTVFFHYEFLDGTDHVTNHEDSFGLVAMTSVTNEATWTKKPSFTAFENMLTIIGDRSSAGPGATGANVTHTLTALDLTVSGGTATRSHFLLQKADGTYWLVLWREEKLYKPTATPPRQTITASTVTLTAAVAKTWQVFTPYTSATGAAATGPTTGKTVSLGEDLLVVKIS